MGVTKGRKVIVYYCYCGKCGYRYEDITYGKSKATGQCPRCGEKELIFLTKLYGYNEKTEKEYKKEINYENQCR